MNKKVAILAVVVMAAAVTIVIALSNDGSTFDAKMEELENDGYSTKEYDGSFSDAQAERVGVVFSESTWSEFKQQVATVKENLGFVTVWCHRSEGFLWVAAYEDQYYYYCVD